MVARHMERSEDISQEVDDTIEQDVKVVNASVDRPEEKNQALGRRALICGKKDCKQWKVSTANRNISLNKHFSINWRALLDKLCGWWRDRS